MRTLTKFTTVSVDHCKSLIYLCLLKAMPMPMPMPMLALWSPDPLSVSLTIPYSGDPDTPSIIKFEC